MENKNLKVVGGKEEASKELVGSGVVGQEETKKEVETVSISKTKLEEMIERMERLEACVSKKELSRYDSKNKKDKEKVVNLFSLQGRVIISWENLSKNVVEKDWRTMAWREEQEMTITFEDGKIEKIPYVEFSRNYNYIPARVIGEKVINEGDDGESYVAEFEVETLEEEGGKKYKILSTFVS